VSELVRKYRKPTEMYCHRFAGRSNVGVRCLGEKCVKFVYYPIRKHQVGGSESHTWCGCVDKLRFLAEIVAYVRDVTLEELLDMNR